MADSEFEDAASDSEYLSLHTGSRPSSPRSNIRVSAIYYKGSLHTDAIPGALAIDDSLHFEYDPRFRSCESRDVVVSGSDVVDVGEVDTASSSILRIVARGKVEYQRVLYFKVGSREILEDIITKVRDLAQSDWEPTLVCDARSISDSLPETKFSGIGSFDIRGLFEEEQRTRIITPDIAEDIIVLLPLSVRFCRWSLAYSPMRHGISLQTFYRALEARGPSLLIIRDSSDQIFGGFATDSWAPTGRYFGTGESFVFACGDEVRAYRAGSSNEFFQFADDTRFAMGGGGSSAIVVESNFLRGVSQACSTYHNPQLSVREDFVVRDLEVWCFDEE